MCRRENGTARSSSDRRGIATGPLWAVGVRVEQVAGSPGSTSRTRISQPAP